MGYYVLKNSNGFYITFDKYSQRYVPIGTLKKAKKWNVSAEASKALVNSVPKKIRNGYRVEYIESDKEQPALEKNKCITPQKIFNKKIEMTNINEWLSKVERVSEMFKDAETKLKSVSEKLSETDKEIVDIQHYIEFGTFNAYEGWCCFKMLQTVLRQRRQYKNEIMVLQKIVNSRLVNPDIEKIRKEVQEVNNQTYKPRILAGLFSKTRVG